MFPESNFFLAVPVISSNNFVSLHLLDWDKLEHVSLIQLVTKIAMKLSLSRNMLSNIQICKNGWLNFSENLRILVLNLLEFTQFLSPNLSKTKFTLILFLYGTGVCCDRR